MYFAKDYVFCILYALGILKKTSNIYKHIAVILTELSFTSLSFFILFLHIRINIHLISYIFIANLQTIFMPKILFLNL